MNHNEEPLVSVLTPVYNGAAFLAQCIESVLRQTYQNYEYIIVNNCSTDQTLEIALAYEETDKRIRVHSNAQFVDVISNHNIAFGLISQESKYCKVVSADDFIFPNCIERMVKCAEGNPSAGFIGSYQLSGSYVRWQGFEYPRALFAGTEVCRRVFLEGNPRFGFGSPTSLMYRADLVRNSTTFYPNLDPHSDTSACFRDLQKCDFGFVYEILSFEKTHADTQSSKSADLNRYSSGYLNDLIQYGPLFLSEIELEQKVNERFNAYHRFLAVNFFVGFRGKEFWKYHESRLEELGRPLKRVTLLWAALKAVFQELLNPEQAIRKLLKRLPAKMNEHPPSNGGGVQSRPKDHNALSA